jgi:hypothetical protein
MWKISLLPQVKSTIQPQERLTVNQDDLDSPQGGARPAVMRADGIATLGPAAEDGGLPTDPATISVVLDCLRFPHLQNRPSTHRSTPH